MNPELQKTADRLRSSRSGKVGAIAAATLMAWVAGAAILPQGLPLSVVLLGLVLGSLSGLTAIGLVLIYRSTRIVNFAQAEIGGLAATVAVVMVTGWHLSYWLALPIGLAVSVATGALIDAVVVRRFFNAPRLILTVATIGLLQILGAAEIGIPRMFTKLDALTRFTTPYHFSFRMGALRFTGDHMMALAVVPLAVGGLGWFFGRSDTGVAIRGAADSNERALLLGVPVRRLSRITWMVAAGLSGVASMLATPILGPSLGAIGGPTALLAPLTAAVIAQMESMTVAMVAALGIGVFQQAVFWSYPRSSLVDVGLFGATLAALLLQRRRLSRVDDGGMGGHIAVKEVRPVPAAMRSLPEVRYARPLLLAVFAALSIVVPLTLSHANVILFTYMALYGIIGVSLVILTGWAGQISLGQFAFAGIGAAVTASLVAHAHVDLFLALVIAAVAGALAALLVGIPALRIKGLFLAVTTLTFAVPVSTFLLNSSYFPTLNPHRIERPPVLQRFDLDKPLTFYYLCLLALGVSLVLARNFRRSRAGRVVLAVRDNERAAASYAISPMRAKLTAFALSGALAGFAGGLFGVAQRGIGFAGFDPVLSVEVFTMVVVGGLGSIPGALLGAGYVRGAEYFLKDAARLLATGAGLLVLLMVVPGGLGELMYGLRDRVLRMIASYRGLEVPQFAPKAEFAAAVDASPDQTAEVPVTMTETAPLIRCTGIDAGYGQIQVLFDVDAEVGEGEIVGLLGTNGAGKSTLLRVVAGLLSPSGGRVELAGVDITRLDPIARVREGIVTVPGGRGVFPSLTVAENLRLAGWLSRHDRAFLDPQMERVFELFPILRERIDERAASLSGGEQQMLTLAQALLCRPRVLLIDELSLGLAPAVVAELLKVVRRLNAEGVTVVVVEQSVNVATTLAGRALFMEKGQVRFSGPTADLVDRTDLLRSVFLSSGTSRRRPPPAAPATTAGRRPRPLVAPGRQPAAAPAPPILELRGVTRRFGGITAIDDVDLTVPRGSVLGVIGSNGAGKTTLFDICSGFLPPDAGHILLDGRDVTELDAAARADRGVGRSFQDARLFPALTVTEVIAVALERHIEVRDPFACTVRLGAVVDSELDVSRRVDELIERMNLQRYRDAFVSELSTGTRRIVELTCALAHDPKVLLLDEPSSGIAQRESEALGDLLLDLKERTGTTLVVIEHDIPLVSSISDQLVCLHLGRVIARGTPAEVLADDAVVASYLGSDDATVRRSGARPAASVPVAPGV